jgi:glycosyltransferase involved in cell wall biosynthesis
MGMLAPWSLSQKRLKKRIAFSVYQRRMLNRAQVLHATAELDIRNFRLLKLKTPIALMTHGVEVPTELPARSEPDPTHLYRSTRTALFLSRLHPGKGVLDLVRVWARLRPEGWRVVIAGPDEDNHKAEIEAAIADAKLESIFSFTGHVSHEKKAQLFVDADLFILPTYSENFGMVVPEALAHGLPVITTTGAPWRVLTETRSGWWVEPGEAGLQSALEQALGLNPSLLREMGLRGREMVVQRFSWESVITRHLELYRWLVSGSDKPSFVFD